MRQKKLLIRILLLVVSVGLVISLALVGLRINLTGVKTSAISLEPPTENALAAEATVSVVENIGLPARLKIPSIGVNAAIVSVGLTPEGAMAMAESRKDAMWYQPGRRPGERGSAVIAGHYVRGASAVFNKLHMLQAGDKVYTEEANGVVTGFVVRESRRYDPNADASDVFGSSDGQVHLNLVTCEGVWDDALQRYSDRLVVFADKE